MKPRALVSWSTGKDSAWALHLARRDYEIVGLVTTISSAYRRVSMHAVREELLEAQAAAIGAPVIKVEIPTPCPNETYERLTTEALRAAAVAHVVFGDLFLEDVRAYREALLGPLGITPVFPLWGLETNALATEMIDAGVEAWITCVDPRRAPRELAGRRIDHALLASLPDDVDPCGERGETHTFVAAGPMMSRRVDVRVGEIVERDGFVFADLVAA